MAVLWLGLTTLNHPEAQANFQAILFNSASVLNGVSFQAGDIVFSYGDISIYNADTLNPETTETIIGLEDASGSSATLPDHEMVSGWHSYDAFGDFPVDEDQYVLFRPEENNYDVSIQTTVIPEPASFVAVTGALMLCGALARRRR